jgi:hypothetical protein
MFVWVHSHIRLTLLMTITMVAQIISVERRLDNYEK